MKISEEKIKEILKLKAEGKTYNQIKELTGCCKNTCIKYLKEYGEHNPIKIIQVTPELLEEIQKRYDEIGNIKKVAKEFHISTTRLRVLGLQVKKPIKTQKELSDQTRYAKRIKEQLVEYKGGKCERCGYNKSMRALEFHHLDPSEKDFGISKQINRNEELNMTKGDYFLLEEWCYQHERVGDVKAKELLKEFKTIKNIKAASVDELQNVKGINRQLAEKIYDFYKED